MIKVAFFFSFFFCVVFNNQLAVHIDEGVDLPSNSRLIAVSIVANRNVNGIVDKPSRPFHFSSLCRRRFDFPEPQYASPGCRFLSSYPSLKLLIDSTTTATTRQPRHKQAATHIDDAINSPYIDCDLIANNILFEYL